MEFMSIALPITDKNFEAINYPIICTPIACGQRHITNKNGVPVDAIGNEIKNNYIRTKIQEYGVVGIDGEIVVAGEGDLLGTTLALKNPTGTPDFEFIVGDIDRHDIYLNRSADLDNLVTKPRPDFIKLKTPVTVYNKEGLLDYWRSCALKGYHGIYAKHDGCTYIKKFIPFYWNACLKYTKWETGWATITGFNGNNNLLKYIVCKDKNSNVSFKIEHGFNASQCKELWRSRAQYTGFTVSYEYQPTGGRIPTTPICKKVSRR